MDMFFLGRVYSMKGPGFSYKIANETILELADTNTVDNHYH